MPDLTASDLALLTVEERAMWERLIPGMIFQSYDIEQGVFVRSLVGDIRVLLTALVQARREVEKYGQHQNGCDPRICQLDGFHTGKCKGGCRCGLTTALGLGTEPR